MLKECTPNQEILYKLTEGSISGMLVPGLRDMFYTMKQGDIAWSKLKPMEHWMEYAEDLYYKITVNKVIDKSQPPPRPIEKTGEEIMNEVKQLKIEGNIKFRDGGYSDAMKIYKKGWNLFKMIKKSVKEELVKSDLADYQKQGSDIGNNYCRALINLGLFKEALGIFSVIKF